MSNPSTVWSQLSLPVSPIGSIPFVDVDSASIITDVGNFKYTSGTDTLIGTGTFKAYQLTITGGLRQAFTDATGTPGAATINKPCGKVKFAAGATTLVVTNSYITATSILQCGIEGAAEDATALRVRVSSQGAGTCTLALNAAATAAVNAWFNVINTF